MDDAGLPALQDAIRNCPGCESTWVEEQSVHEKFEGKTVWKGAVQVFDLTGHTAPRCYAWSHATTGDKRKFYAVLHVQPIDGAVSAVRAAIVSSKR